MAQGDHLAKSNLYRHLGWEESDYRRVFRSRPPTVSIHQIVEQSITPRPHHLPWEFEPPSTPDLRDFKKMPWEVQLKIAGYALECPGVVYVVPRDPLTIFFEIYAFVVAGLVQGTQEFPIDLSFLFVCRSFYYGFRQEFLRNNTFFFRNSRVKDVFESYFKGINLRYRALSCPLAWADCDEAMNVLTKSVPVRMPTTRLKRVKLGFLVNPPIEFLNTSGRWSVRPRRITDRDQRDAVRKWKQTGQTLAKLSDVHEVRLDLEVHDPLFDESEWSSKDQQGRFKATVKIVMDSFLKALRAKSKGFNVAYTKHARVIFTMGKNYATLERGQVVDEFGKIMRFRDQEKTVEEEEEEEDDETVKGSDTSDGSGSTASSFSSLE